jgi:hypothetical protein
MSLSDLRERARQGLLDFAWGQWGQLGLSAHLTRSDRWAVDPEALVLFTIEVGRRDPRLFDEVLDWLAHNRRLLSLQRLRNLTSRFQIDPGLVGAVVAWIDEPASSSRPPEDWHGREGHADMPVFSSDVLAFVGEPDPVFAKYGYVRPRASRSGKSSEPDLRRSVNLAFQLRHLFGPGSRSEVVRILLTFAEGPLDAARIADEAGFAKRNVSDSLAALVAARVVKARWSRNERVFLAYREKWAELLEIRQSADQMPAFVSWTHLLAGLLAILAWLESEAESTDSEYLISSRARDLMERVGPDIGSAGVVDLPILALPGQVYLPAFVATVDSLLVAIETGSLGGTGYPVAPDRHLGRLDSSRAGSLMSSARDARLG